VDKSVDIDRNFGRKLRQAVSFSLSKSYLELLKAKRTVQIQEEAIAQLQEHLKNAEALYSIGKVSNLDVIKAKVQIEVALDELAKSKNQLDVQRNNLNVLCGNALGDSFDVADNVDEWWKEYSAKTYSFSDLKTLLPVQHPDLENINTQKELRNKEIQLYNKDYYPNLYAFGITNVEDSKIPMGNLNWNVGVTVKNNLLKLDDYKSRLSGSEKIVKLAEESLVTANLKYNIGKGNSLDVLDAETVLTTAKLNYNQIIIDLLSSIAELNYNIGSDEIPFNK